MKRRPIEVFSLSFLDCICCGFGAVILLFVLINAKSVQNRQEIVADLRGEVNKLETEVLTGRKGMVLARNSLRDTTNELVRTEGLAARIVDELSKRRDEVAAYTNSTLASRAHVNKLKADIKSLEEDVKRLQAAALTAPVPGQDVRPFPGDGDRHYLTGIRMGGKRILILLDASSSMLAAQIVDILRMRNLPPERQRLAPKWRQAVRTVDWMLTRFPAGSTFQLYSFNETAGPVDPATAGKWLDANDPKLQNQVMAAVNQLVPAKGTSLSNAFRAAREMNPPPDNIFLITDGLPTQGAAPGRAAKITGRQRLKYFDEALRTAGTTIPVNIILLPMEGDPLAASSFWRLCIQTKGSMLAPADDWP